MAHDYALLDVFGRGPLQGNPLAVVFDADGLSPAERQQVARWFNLSETTFVGRPTAAGVPFWIHTPNSELPFAGHPTVGTAQALRLTGRQPADGFTLLPPRGPVTVRFDGERPTARLAPPTARAVHDPPAVQRALGAQALHGLTRLDAGAVWLTGRVDDDAALYGLRLDWDALTAACQAEAATGVTLYAGGPGADGPVQVRSFAPGDAVPEDPVCGSGNVCAAWHRFGLQGRHGLTHVGLQGRALGRDGEVRVLVERDAVVLSGAAVVVGRGTLTGPFLRRD